MKFHRKVFFIYLSILFLKIVEAGTLAPDFSDVIPEDRRIEWTNVGVPGGIPEQSKIVIDFRDPAIRDKYKVYPNDDIDDADGLRTAVQDASQKNMLLKTRFEPGDILHEIRLPEGRFDIFGYFRLGPAAGYVLRGEGMSKTILHAHKMINSGGSNYSTEEIIITNGYWKGSTELTVTNSGALTVGKMVEIRQDNDSSLMWSRWDNKNILRQLVMVIEIDEASSRIVIDPPLVWPPKSWAPAAPPNPRLRTTIYNHSRLLGLENLTIEGDPNNTGGYSLWLNESYGVWLKNVEMAHANSHALFMSSNLRTEIRDSYFHDTSSTGDGFGIECYSSCNGVLIENNIFKTYFHSIILNQTVNSVVGYNYAIDARYLGWPTYQTADFNANHGPHGMMVLYEGNEGAGFMNDGYHGSTSHLTLFRNWLHGDHYNPKRTGNKKPVDLTRYSYFHNVVGNVLGHDNWPKDIGQYEMEGKQSYTSQPVIYRLGYPNVGNNYYVDGNEPGNVDAPGLDPKVKETLLRHGNYDTYNEAILWNENPDYGPFSQNLPASLYLSQRPLWWDASTPWPPFGPDRFPMTTSIAAKKRFEYYEKFGIGVEPGGTSVNNENLESDNETFIFHLFKNKVEPGIGKFEISFEVNEETTVHAYILDRQGHVISELINETIRPNIVRKIIWDGRNKTGKTVASGVYIVRFESSTNKVDMKVVVVK